MNYDITAKGYARQEFCLAQSEIAAKAFEKNDAQRQFEAPAKSTADLLLNPGNMLRRGRSRRKCLVDELCSYEH
jgi:hypothetical protein